MLKDNKNIARSVHIQEGLEDKYFLIQFKLILYFIKMQKKVFFSTFLGNMMFLMDVVEANFQLF